MIRLFSVQNIGGEKEDSTSTIGKRKNVEFSEPEPVLERRDSDDMRTKTLDMSYSEWQWMAFSKGSINYLKGNTKADKPFKTYGKTMEKLDG